MGGGRRNFQGKHQVRELNIGGIDKDPGIKGDEKVIYSQARLDV